MPTGSSRKGADQISAVAEGKDVSDTSEAAREIWKSAGTRYEDKTLEEASPTEAGEISRMPHLAVPGSETLLPTDWGAVVAWPFTWTDDELHRFTGLTTKQMLCEELRLRSSAMGACKPVLVRVGAACDYAQNNRGPIYIPESAERQAAGGRPIKLSDAIGNLRSFSCPVRRSPPVCMRVSVSRRHTFRMHALPGRQPVVCGNNS